MELDLHYKVLLRTLLFSSHKRDEPFTFSDFFPSAKLDPADPGRSAGIGIIDPVCGVDPSW